MYYKKTLVVLTIILGLLITMSTAKAKDNGKILYKMMTSCYETIENTSNGSCAKDVLLQVKNIEDKDKKRVFKLLKKDGLTQKQIKKMVGTLVMADGCIEKVDPSKLDGDGYHKSIFCSKFSHDTYREN